MKGVLLLSVLLISSFNLWSQNDNPAYNKALADSLGADENGMKIYYLVILKTGPNITENQESRNRLFKGHMENINRLVKMNKLVVAGPFEDNDKSYRGLFILTCNSPEEAKDLLDTDPAIKAKIFDTEIYKWYGSAALPLYLQFTDNLEKKKN